MLEKLKAFEIDETTVCGVDGMCNRVNEKNSKMEIYILINRFFLFISITGNIILKSAQQFTAIQLY